MEHRWSKRLATSIDVLLYHNRVPVSRCKARDVGSGGMTLVDFGPLRYPIYTRLEVEFELECDHRRQRYRLPAMVIHNFKESMGVMFPETESETVQALRRSAQDNDDSQPSAKGPGMASSVQPCPPLRANSS